MTLKLRLILLFLALSLSPAWAENVVGPSNVILCNKVGILEAGSAGSQLVIPAVAGQAINVCGWNVTNSGATATAAITGGTQTTTPCDTGTKKLSPTFSVSSTSPNADHTTYATQSLGSGQALCINTGAATTVSGLIWYSQF